MKLQDVLTMLKRDYEAAEVLLDHFDSTPTTERVEYLGSLTRTLIGHEVAKERVVYPVLRDGSAEARAVADQRLGEQAEAEELLAALGHMNPRTGAFTNRFKRLRRGVLDHARAEETTAFPLLEAMTTAAERRDLGARDQTAKDAAPTRPHPRLQASRVARPVAALLDGARDAVDAV